MGSKEFYEREHAELQKQNIYIEQECRCFTCGELLPYSQAQAAHRMAKHKWLLEKYGKEVIHHRFNIRVTCAGDCNDAVMISPDTLPALELIEEIRADLNKR